MREANIALETTNWLVGFYLFSCIDNTDDQGTHTHEAAG